MNKIADIDVRPQKLELAELAHACDVDDRPYCLIKEGLAGTQRGGL